MASKSYGRTNKKLAGASIHWASGGRASKESQVEQFKRESEMYGIPLESLMETIEDAEPDEFEIWPENADSLALFLKCATQWDLSEGRVTRLNYPALHTIMAILQTPDQAQAFVDIQVMERAALESFSKR